MEAVSCGLGVVGEGWRTERLLLAEPVVDWLGQFNKRPAAVVVGDRLVLPAPALFEGIKESRQGQRLLSERAVLDAKTVPPK